MREPNTSDEPDQPLLCEGCGEEDMDGSLDRLGQCPSCRGEVGETPYSEADNPSNGWRAPEPSFEGEDEEDDRVPQCEGCGEAFTPLVEGLCENCRGAYCEGCESYSLEGVDELSLCPSCRGEYDANPYH